LHARKGGGGSLACHVDITIKRGKAV